MADQTVHDVIIIGSGPAGYSAGVYTGRAQLDTLMLAGEQSGGQLMYTTEVENYAGFKDGVLGPQLMMDMRAQCERFGTVIIDRFVDRIDASQRPFKVHVKDEVFQAKAIILATGAQAILTGVPGEDTYMGRGVAVCAVCDAAFYRNKVTIVVGGGDAAMEDTLALTKFASHITLLVRSDKLRASKIMQDRVLKDNADKVTVLYNTSPKEVIGDDKKVTSVVIKDNQTGKEQTLNTDGFFLAIGHRPATDFLKGQIELDQKGYIVSRLALHQASLNLASQHLDKQGLLQFPTMTSVEGIFAAGDNVDFRYRQAITAAGYGCMASLDAERWLEQSIGKGS